MFNLTQQTVQTRANTNEYVIVAVQAWYLTVSTTCVCYNRYNIIKFSWHYDCSYNLYELFIWRIYIIGNIV